MKLIALLLLTLCLTVASYVQQTTDNWFNQKLKSADSVLMVSHHRTKGHIEIDSIGNQVAIQELILNNKPNYSIVLERKLISGKALDSLNKILMRPSVKSDYTLSGCFSPHHAIFIFKGDKLSYLNLCFSCVREERSEDLSSLPIFDPKRWSELKAFYIKQGFKYQLKNGR